MTMEEDEAELLKTLTLIPTTTTNDQTPTLAPLPVPVPAPVLPPPPPPIAPIPTIPKPQQTPNAAPASIDDYEISEESRLARERHDKAVQELLLKRRAYALAVPTNDSAVRSRLRRLSEPVTLFGEREMERRDRLRSLMLKLDAEGQLDRLLKAHDEDDQALSAEAEEADEKVSYPFYTEGPAELAEVRKEMARLSVAKARNRLERARRRRDDPDEDVEGEAREAERVAGEFQMDCSEIGDERPLSGCSFSNDGSMLATSAWSGVTKIWSMPQVTKIATLKGHKERVTDVTFSPVDNLLVTASADRTAKLWKSDGTLLKSFEGHLDRLARVSFYPSGKYFGTASFDKTWRLWDVESGIELLLQEGHSRSVYGITFHPDGSLAASCGLDALTRVWDLRTGRSILVLEGHVKPVLAVSFSPNGYHLATGSEDNTCRIWDLRKRKCEYTIPAHSHLISQVKFEPQEGYFLATASYDTKAMVWSAQDFKSIKTLAGHEAKVTGLDITGDGQQIATVAHDRTIKIWSSRSNGKEKAMMDID